MEPPLYEDNHLLIVNKVAGLLTQPSGQEGAASLEGQCKQWIKERDGKKGNVYLHALHRLDRPASGIVLFAKSSKALSRLNNTLRQGSFGKHYLAIIEGEPPSSSGTIEHLLAHGSHRAIVTSEGKRACLHYQVKESAAGLTLVEITLETGRYHQIRAQLSAIGCPIVGDGKYGATKTSEVIALQHHRLTFPHPVTTSPITVQLSQLLALPRQEK